MLEEIISSLSTICDEVYARFDLQPENVLDIFSVIPYVKRLCSSWKYMKSTSLA